ncbi:MAG: SDR family oxidoreductase [Actinomycetota bacterium]
MEFAGKNIVVTGGASGIGRGLCERFAALGAANVVVADLDPAGANAVAEAIGGTAKGCDVSDDASTRTMVEETLAEIGHIDLFFANAGIGTGGDLDASDQLWDLSWRVNVLGAVHAARYVIPHMEARGGGGFVITASSAGLTTGPVSLTYAVSKHAVVGVAEWLAINHGPRIAVSAICPTIVDTPMAAEFGATMVQPMGVETVVDATIDGLTDGRFLITPAPMALDMLQAKAQDYDGFLAQLQTRVQGLGNR